MYLVGTMTEQWLPVAGAKGYEVSSLGNIRSARRPVGMKLARASSQDYLRVCMQGKYRLVHRVVLEAFVGPCPPGHQARHLNDIGDDNRLENLAWGTAQDNRSDAVRNGNLRSPHDTVPAPLLDAAAIKAAHAAGVSLKKLARQHRASIAALSDIVRDRPRKAYFLQSRVSG